MRMWDLLRDAGYAGSYDAVRRYAQQWRRAQGQGETAYVPLTFEPGEAYQFDWSHEIVVLAGVTTTVKVAHMRLCHSRMPFVRAYPRETQEMVFDAPHPCVRVLSRRLWARHLRQHEDGGRHRVRRQGPAVQPPLRAVVQSLPDEPVACTPGAGWEKGQVENQVGTIRERWFTPRLRFASYAELNAWLLDQCVATARRQPHPDDPTRTVFAVFEAERAALIPYRGPFEGSRLQIGTVSKTCLVRFDHNRYSVMARAVGRPVEIAAYAERIVIRQDGAIVGEHARRFGRGQTSYDPWHYVPGAESESRGRCATARRSRAGSCRARWAASNASSPVLRTATGRSSRSSVRCSVTGSRPSTRPVRRRSPLASPVPT